MPDHPAPCPIAPVTALLAGRWAAEVIWVLDHEGPHRFTELQRRLDPITPKVLTGRLKELERDGFVRRTSFRELPPRVVYEATDRARSLRPLLDAMADWCAMDARA